MIKLLILLISIAITTTAFSQIKVNKTIAKSFEPAKQNVAMMAALNTNTDSVEIQQLFEAYKTADADANAKLEKLIAKMKVVNERNANKVDEKKRAASELEMIDVQQLMAKRGQMLQFVTNIIKAMNDEQKKIAENIR